MRLVIIVPVYNEIAKMQENVRAIHEFAQKSLKLPSEIVISAYRSSEMIDEAGRALESDLSNVHYFSTDVRGKGFGIMQAAGLFAKEGDWVGFVDVDLPVDLSRLKDVERLVLDDRCDLIAGSRHTKGSIRGSGSRRALSKAYIILANAILFASMKVDDFQTGFKFWRAGLLKEIGNGALHHGLFFDTSLIYLSIKLGKRVCYLPVDYILDEEGNSTVNPLLVSLDFLFNLLRLKLSRL